MPKRLSAQADLIPLTELAAALRVLTGEQPPRYRVLYNLVLSDLIATTRISGRHFVPRSALPGIVALLRKDPPKSRLAA